MTPNKGAALAGYAGSGADPQAQGSSKLNSTEAALREAVSGDGLLHMLVDLPAEGGRYVRAYKVTLRLNVEPVGTSSSGGDA